MAIVFTAGHTPARSPGLKPSKPLLPQDRFFTLDRPRESSGTR